jgi:hypothetical protein
MEASHGSNKKSHVVLDVLGPTVEFLVLPSDCEGGYCVIKCTIPPVSPFPFTVTPTTKVFFYSPAAFRLWCSGRMVSKG